MGFLKPIVSFFKLKFLGVPIVLINIEKFKGPVYVMIFIDLFLCLISWEEKLGSFWLAF